MHTHHTWYAFMARFLLQMYLLFWHYVKRHPENMVARTLLVEHIIRIYGTFSAPKTRLLQNEATVCTMYSFFNNLQSSFF